MADWEGAIPLPAEALHQAESAAALAFVDFHFGDSTAWPSPLISYRLSSAWQADWKEEVGHWLKTAERLGFLGKFMRERIVRAKRESRSTDVDPNDPLHRVLSQELAEAMVTHYLDGTGLSFAEWQPVGLGGDVDVVFRAPDGNEVFVQVKAPDQPGRVVGRRLIDGEYDDRIVQAALKAAGQLRKARPAVKLITVCPNRSPLAPVHDCLISEFIGETVGGDSVTLPESRLGRFWSDCKHVSGVMVLDLVRPASGSALYGAVVLLNPVANIEAAPDWFPHAHVCTLEGSTFRWVRGEPFECHFLPDGTVIVPD